MIDQPEVKASNNNNQKGDTYYRNQKQTNSESRTEPSVNNENCYFPENILNIENDLKKNEYIVNDEYGDNLYKGFCLKTKRNSYFKIVTNKQLDTRIAEFEESIELFKNDLVLSDILFCNEKTIAFVYECIQFDLKNNGMNQDIPIQQSFKLIQKILRIMDIIIELRINFIPFDEEQSYAEKQIFSEENLDDDTKEEDQQSDDNQIKEPKLLSHQIKGQTIANVLMKVIKEYQKINYEEQLDKSLIQQIQETIYLNCTKGYIDEVNDLFLIHKQLFNCIARLEYAMDLIYYAKCIERILYKLQIKQEKNQVRLETSQYYCDLLIIIHDISQYQGNIHQLVYNQGLWLLQFNQFQMALFYSLISIKFKRKIVKENHIEIIDSLFALGLCLLQMNLYEEALQIFERSLKMKQLQYPGDHPQIAESLTAMSEYYSKTNHPEQSLQFSLGALKIRESLFKTMHHEIALSLNHVGIYYEQLGKYNIALEYQLKSLKMYQEIHKGVHHDIAASLSCVGSCYRQIGQFEQALVYELQSYEMRIKCYPQIHPLIATSLNNVGLCYQYMGNSLESVKYQLKSLEMRRQLFKENHIDIATSLNNLSACYIDLSQPSKGLDFLLQSLHIIRCLKGQKDIQIVSILNNVAQCYRELGEKQNALTYQLECLEIANQLLPKNHTQIATYLNNAGLCYIDCDNQDSAIQYLQNSLEILQSNSGSDSIQKAEIFYNLSFCFLQIENFGVALENAQKSLNMRQNLLSNTHPDVKDSLEMVEKCEKKIKDIKTINEYCPLEIQNALSFNEDNDPTQIGNKKLVYEIDQKIQNNDDDDATIVFGFQEETDQIDQLSFSNLVIHIETGYLQDSDFEQVQQNSKNNDVNQEINDLNCLSHVDNEIKNNICKDYQEVTPQDFQFNNMFKDSFLLNSIDFKILEIQLNNIISDAICKYDSNNQGLSIEEQSFNNQIHNISYF